MNFALVTLGCKLNQYDSAVLSGRLAAAGLTPSGPERAGVIFLNTCTVTHRADRDARRLLRSLRRENPSAILAVLGCSVRLAPGRYRDMPEVDAVLEDAAALDRFLSEKGIRCGTGPCLPHFGERTRAFLKVQEGCDFPCAYCIVPAVRGPSRSVPPGEVEEGFRALLGAGYKEVVLTGINTGEYGRDLGLEGGLAHLLERLLEVPGKYRLRLNSVEPKAVTRALVSLFKREGALAPHLQIPLQSGSDRVLKTMRRNYTSAFYEDLVRGIAEEVPGVGLGADVLAGFPTESPEEFEATLSLVARLPLAFLHAFSYSPRPGTPASRLPPVDSREAHARTCALRALGDEKRAVFASSFVGRSLEALTLAGEGGKGRALTGNFLDVELDGAAQPNRFVRVTILSVEKGSVRGAASEL